MIAEQLRCLSRHDLGGQGRCGEGTAVLEHGGRRYLYLAHEQPPANFSVLDVTDPRAPRLLTQTRLPHGGVRSNSLAVGDGLLLVAYQVQAPGQQPAGIEVFDLSLQAGPRLAGRFGPHNLHENEPFGWAWQSEEIIFGAFFSAGVRAFDIRDPFQPRQVAAFEPAGPVQINDVYVTADGIVYAVNRDGGGLYILEYSGPG